MRTKEHLKSALQIQREIKGNILLNLQPNEKVILGQFSFFIGKTISEGIFIDIQIMKSQYLKKKSDILIFYLLNCLNKDIRIHTKAEDQYR